MTFDDLHQVAEKTTPSDVEVPKSWPGLLVWAMGKWGVGVIFAAMLVPVYADFKALSTQVLQITSENIKALNAVTNKLELLTDKVETLQSLHNNHQ